jgi:enoyl-CoA hydratase/carnithine racemase
MTVDSLRELTEAIDGAGYESLLIRGQGSAFSAGLDLDALGGDLWPLLEAMENAASALFLRPAPTVACINGHAIAGGCLLAIACEYRVVASDPKLRMGMTALGLGVVYPPLVLEIIRYRLPNHTRERVLLGAQRVGPHEALALGMVDEVADDVLSVAQTRLRELAEHPRAAYAHTKLALRRNVLAMDANERQLRLEEATRAWDPERVRARLKR